MPRLFLLGGALVMLASACAPPTSSTGSGQPTKRDAYPPCHPGCFPAGTPVLTPEGPLPIESLGIGDPVTLIRPDGTTAVGTVSDCFRTTNRLVEVRTEAGCLRCTQTQPLCLHGGAFAPANALTSGDLVWRWEAGQRRAVGVLAVLPTGEEATVFNLVVGESAVFVADGFLARGKPPLR